MPSFSALERPQILQELRDQHFDVLIIGGGITGCGIALDAASRGLKVCLIEMNDFASGTSSKSTKLIHGGLRYLKQFEISLVREVGKERAIVHRLAPHLVTSEKMLLPIVKNGTFGKLLTSVGLMVYDLVAGVERPEQRKMLTKEQTLQIEPLLPEQEVEGGGLYAEYRTDDARLTIEIIKTAVAKGATAINYVRAEDFYYENDLVKGAKCADLIGGGSFEVRADYVVSAAGPWVDDLRKTNHSLNKKHLYLTKGVHIVVPHHKFPLKYAVYFDVPDGRMIFAIPRGRTTYIGTTDTHYTGDKNDVRSSKEDVDYLLKGIHNTFSSINLQQDDVISSWAGLRPLIYEEGKSASEISRKDEIFESKTGLISIAGGKLTGYRKMSQKVVDLLGRKIKKSRNTAIGPCKTDKITLSGGPFNGKVAVDAYLKEVEEFVEGQGLDPYAAEYLVKNYGRQTETILSIYRELGDDDPRIRLPKAELRYCIENELVQFPMDFVARRTGRLYFEIDTLPRLTDVLIQDFKSFFNWNEEETKRQDSILKDNIKKATAFE